MNSTKVYLDDLEESLAHKIENVVNQNLLHNWYFGNPINRNGKTEYTESGHTIDRWFKSKQGKMILDNDNGKIIFDNTDGESTTWYQFFLDNNIYDLLYNQTVTGSMLMSNGELKVATGTFAIVNSSSYISSDLDEFGNGLRLYAKANEGYPAFQIQVLAGYSLEIVACKYELGDQQTLAHQDENGNWVLNEIPDYAEQMAICMQYDKSSGAYIGGSLPLDGSVAMDLLWENASPSSTFSPQTISLDLSGYNMVGIVCSAHNTATDRFPLGIVEVGETLSLLQPNRYGNNTGAYARDFIVSETGVSVGNGINYIPGSTAETNAKYAIPHRIYGIK